MKLSIDYFTQAVGYSEDFPEDLVTCYNNLSCYYKKLNNNIEALKYLEKALQLLYTKLIRLDDQNFNQTKAISSLADTHLNLSAVLSQSRNHQNALLHSKKALMLLQSEILSNQISPLQKYSERWCVLIIAYYNMGAEYEHLKMVSGYLSSTKPLNRMKAPHHIQR
jgi:tetratricopeptide (TPR) repeat protein